MTFRHRIYLLLARRPSSAMDLAKRYGLRADKVRDAFRGLKRAGCITFVAQCGHERVYRVTGKAPREDGRGRSPGSATGRKLGPGSRPKVRRMTTPNEKRYDIPRERGYGSGRVAIEMCWPMRAQTTH